MLPDSGFNLYLHMRKLKKNQYMWHCLRKIIGFQDILGLYEKAFMVIDMSYKVGIVRYACSTYQVLYLVAHNSVAAEKNYINSIIYFIIDYEINCFRKKDIFKWLMCYYLYIFGIYTCMLVNLVADCI